MRGRQCCVACQERLGVTSGVVRCSARRAGSARPDPAGDDGDEFADLLTNAHHVVAPKDLAILLGE